MLLAFGEDTDACSPRTRLALVTSRPSGALWPWLRWNVSRGWATLFAAQFGFGSLPVAHKPQTTPEGLITSHMVPLPTSSALLISLCASSLSSSWSTGGPLEQRTIHAPFPRMSRLRCAANQVPRAHAHKTQDGTGGHPVDRPSQRGICRAIRSDQRHAAVGSGTPLEASGAVARSGAGGLASIHPTRWPEPRTIINAGGGGGAVDRRPCLAEAGTRTQV